VPPFALDTGAILLVLLFVVQSIFAMMRTWLFTAAGERIVAQLRARLFEAILSQDVEFFDHRRTGELTNRLSADTTILQGTVTVQASTGLRYLLGAVGAGALLLWMSPRMTLVWHNAYFYSLWTDDCRLVRLPERLFPLYFVLAPLLWILSLLRR
jgi:ABC-type bacteriocin/lantibiotic exporter with double-glycine peptidase domain